MKETKFKQTEVGMIPSDWEVCQLKHECSLITKGTTPSSLGYSFAATGINFLKIEAIEKSGKLIKENLAYIDEITNRALFRSQLQENDLLVSIAGALGRLFIVDASVLPANTNQALAIIRLKKNTLFNHKYLFYYLSSDPIQNLIKDLTVTGAQPNISLENVRNFLIGFPVSPKEQQRIANALSDVDTLINNLEKLITKKKNIKQGAMQQLLTGKKRLPGFAPAKPTYKQTELGKIPADWEVKTIKELGVFLGGGTPSTKNESFWKGNIPWISSADLSDDDIEHISMTRFISQEAVNCSATQICPQGTILIIARVGVGKLALSQQKVCTSQDFCNLIPSKENNSKFLAYALLPVMKQMANETQGTSIKGVAADEIKKVQILVPSSKAEQTAIANILSDMDTEIATLETKLAKYRTLKTGMMQQLLTGKIRLV